MSDDDNKENNSHFEDSNQKKLSNFSSYLKDDYNEDNSTTPKNSINETIKIKLNETNFIDDFQYENEIINEREERDFSFNDFTSIENQNAEESFGFDSIINYEYNFSTYIEKLNYLIKNYDKQFLKNIKKPIIKCLLGEIEGNNNKECNNIPLITKKRFCISFFCDNHNNKKNMTIEAYALLKNINKIFIRNPRLIQNNNTENFNNLINFFKENMFKFELNITTLKRKIQYYKTDIRKTLKEKIKDFQDLLNDYNNKNKYDESFRFQSLKKIQIIYIAFLEKLNLLIYLIIINRLLYEYQYLNILSDKNKINLLINLKNALILIEGNKYIYKISTKKKEKKEKKKKKKHESLNFNWITELYFEEEMTSNINKNIFIAINETGVIYILLIYFKSTDEIFIEKKENPYELINVKKINDFKPVRITKLKKLFKTKTTDNYFIINSKKNIEFGKAIIINVIENSNYIDIKERYKIEIIQTIKDTNGLYSSMEFFYNNKSYLVSFYNNFYLWTYNPEMNKIIKNITENEINDDDKVFNYGCLIYEESKKLFIIQCLTSKLIIEFYKLVEENENLTFNKIDKNIEFKEEESTLKINNNYYIHNNRFLLLSSGKMKKDISGGIYTIDLEKYELISFHRFPNTIAINSIIPSKRNDIILLSSIIWHKKYRKSLKDKSNEKNDNKLNNYIKRGRLITMEIKIVNDKISFKIQNFSEGQFHFINCKNLILDEYIFTSFHKNNNLIKLKENGKFIQYFKINN